MSNEPEHRAIPQTGIQSVFPAVIMIPEYQLSTFSDPGHIHRSQELINEAIVNIRKYSQQQEQVFDEDEDFKWFTSGEANVKRFKGKYIAIWRKQIIEGSSAAEVERTAKDRYGEHISPRVTFVPEDEISDL